jgi:hypothetical protein
VSFWCPSVCRGESPQLFAERPDFRLDLSGRCRVAPEHLPAFDAHRAVAIGRQKVHDGLRGSVVARERHRSAVVIDSSEYHDSSLIFN